MATKEGTLAAKDGKIFSIGNDQVRDFFLTKNERVVIATNSPARFAGYVGALTQIRRKYVEAIQMPVDNQEEEPRFEGVGFVDKHSMKTSRWKIRAAEERIRNLGIVWRGIILTGDVGKSDGHIFFEKPRTDQEALRQAEKLYLKPHFILSGVSVLWHDFDGYDGNVIPVSTWGAVPVWVNHEGIDWQHSVNTVPGGFDFLKKQTLECSQIACRRDSMLAVPEERCSLDLEGVNWISGSKLWEQPGRRRLLLGMIYSPKNALRRVLQAA